MIIRIVKMTFKQEDQETFLSLFNEVYPLISTFEGCSNLYLWRDTQNPSIMFTHSNWISEQHLERYRNSELFQTTWAKTKVLFSDKPKAWSVESITPSK